MDKILELLGVKSLSESKQNTVKSILTNLIQNRIDIDPQSYDSNMTKLMENIGGHKLKTDDQRNLIEKLTLIIDIQSKKITDEKPLNENRKIRKDFFKWDSAAVVKKSVDKVTKNMFQWESIGYGGRAYETKSNDKSHGTKIFFDRNTKKILYSDHPTFLPNNKITESDINKAISQGYSIIPWNTSDKNWKSEMMIRVNKERI